MKTKTWYMLNENERKVRKNCERFKSLFYIILCVITLTLIIIYNSNITKKAIDECVRLGNTYNYCEERLG